MRKLALLAVTAVMAFGSGEVRADGGPFGTPCNGPNCNHHPGILGIFHRGGQTLPVYQAAPWYLYWPYDAHFLTPAPMTGAFYAPPMNYYPVQPYFPQQNYGYMAPYNTAPGNIIQPNPMNPGKSPPPAPSVSGGSPIPSNQPPLLLAPVSK